MRHRKKMMALAIAILLLVTAALAGCASRQSENVEKDPAGGLSVVDPGKTAGENDKTGEDVKTPEKKQDNNSGSKKTGEESSGSADSGDTISFDKLVGEDGSGGQNGDDGGNGSTGQIGNTGDSESTSKEDGSTEAPQELEKEKDNPVDYNWSPFT